MTIQRSEWKLQKRFSIWRKTRSQASYDPPSSVRFAVLANEGTQASLRPRLYLVKQNGQDSLRSATHRNATKHQNAKVLSIRRTTKIVAICEHPDGTDTRSFKFECQVNCCPYCHHRMPKGCMGKVSNAKCGWLHWLQTEIRRFGEFSEQAIEQADLEVCIEMPGGN